MDIVKNTVLSLLRAESAKRKPTKQKSLRCESVKFSKNESKDQWVFTASDMGMSGVPTYTLNTPVRLENEEVYVLVGVDIMSPDLDAAVDQEGYFILYQAEEGVYGFQADFGEDFDTMIYFYGSLDETKECIEKLKDYISGLPDDINADIDEFVKLIKGGSEANEDEDFSMDDVSIDVQDTSEAIDYVEELDDLVDGDCMRLLDYLADHLSREGMKYFYEFVRDKVRENQEELNASNEDEDFSMDVQEPTINEASKEYTFHVPCEATITITADSEDLAKEVLARETSIEVEEDVVEFANGDATLRAVDFNKNALNNLQPDSMSSMD